MPLQKLVRVNIDGEGGNGFYSGSVKKSGKRELQSRSVDHFAMCPRACAMQTVPVVRDHATLAACWLCDAATQTACWQPAAAMLVACWRYRAAMLVACWQPAAAMQTTCKDVNIPNAFGNAPPRKNINKYVNFALLYALGNYIT